MKYSTDVADLEISFLNCRLKGHHWTHVTDDILATSDKKKNSVPTLVRRAYVCLSCKTEMGENIAIPSFQVQSRNYYYPDNYLVRQTTGDRVYVNDIRKESLIRAGLIKS